MNPVQFILRVFALLWLTLKVSYWFIRFCIRVAGAILNLTWFCLACVMGSVGVSVYPVLAKWVANCLGRMNAHIDTALALSINDAHFMQPQPLEIAAQGPSGVPAQVTQVAPAQVAQEIPAQVAQEIPAQLPQKVPAQLPQEVPAQLPQEIPVQLPPAQSICYSASRQRKERKPESYSGKDDLEDYLAHFESVADYNEWDDWEAGIQLSMALSGDARQVWVDSGIRGKISYQILSTVLRDRFQPQGQEEYYQFLFHGRRREVDESYMDYGCALKRLARRGYNMISEKPREVLIMRQFLNDQEVELKRFLKLKSPRTIEEMARLSMEFELVTLESKVSSHACSGNCSVKAPLPGLLVDRMEKTDSQGICEECKNNISQHRGWCSQHWARKKGGISPDVVKRRFLNRLCFKCGSPDHRADACSTP